MGHSNLYVCCSRVRKGSDVRFLAGNSNGDFSHLTHLQPNDDLLRWLKGFNQSTGYWDRRNCSTTSTRKQTKKYLKKFHNVHLS